VRARPQALGIAHSRPFFASHAPLSSQNRPVHLWPGAWSGRLQRPRAGRRRDGDGQHLRDGRVRRCLLVGIGRSLWPGNWRWTHLGWRWERPDGRFLARRKSGRGGPGWLRWERRRVGRFRWRRRGWNRRGWNGRGWSRRGARSGSRLARLDLSGGSARRAPVRGRSGGGARLRGSLGRRLQRGKSDHSGGPRLVRRGAVLLGD
jgi:hypothetical protein